MSGIPPIWTAFKELPFIAKIGFFAIPFLGLVLVASSYAADQSMFTPSEILNVRYEGYGITFGLGAFNMVLLTVFALAVEKHPQIWKNATATRDFWNRLE